MLRHFYSLKILFLTVCLLLMAITATFAQRPYITVWNTELTNSGSTDTNQIEIFAAGDYTYTWEEVGDPANFGSGIGYGVKVLTFPKGGIYRLKMLSYNNNGNPFVRIVFGGSNPDFQKLLKVEQWGDIEWVSMEDAYFGALNLTITAIDIPNLSKVTSMSFAFAGTTLDSIPNLNKWDVSKVKDMSGMFYNAINFNQNISNWNVGNITSMEGMFSRAYHFNQPIGQWDVSKVTSMETMFNEATSFNQDIGNWDVQNVQSMRSMFRKAAAFNQPLNNWNVSDVLHLGYMFDEALQFNQPLNKWKVSKVQEMDYMFHGDSSFNQPLDTWDVSNVKTMAYMFSMCYAFNQPLNHWDVKNVNDMTGIFNEAYQFNQPLSNWDVGSVTSMREMFFKDFRFDQSLGNWDLSSVTNMVNMFHGNDMSCENYSSTLVGWADNPNTSGEITLSSAGLEYSPDVVGKRNKLIQHFHWTISGDSKGDCKFSTLGFNAVSVYPNPAKSFVFISGLDSVGKVKLIDITGRTLRIYPINTPTFQIDLSPFEGGVYGLLIYNKDNQMVFKKIVKI